MHGGTVQLVGPKLWCGNMMSKHYMCEQGKDDFHILINNIFVNTKQEHRKKMSQSTHPEVPTTIVHTTTHSVSGMEDNSVSAMTSTSSLSSAISDKKNMVKDVRDHIWKFYVPRFVFQHVIHDYKDAFSTKLLHENGELATHFVETMTSPSVDRLSGKHVILAASLEDKKTYFRLLWRMALEMKEGGIRDALVKKKTAVYTSTGSKFKSKFENEIGKVIGNAPKKQILQCGNVSEFIQLTMMEGQAIPAIETLLCPDKCPRRYWIFFNCLLKGCNQNNKYWDSVTFDKDGKNSRYVTLSVEAHCVCLLKEHYWSWVYQAIVDSGMTSENLDDIRFEYDPEDVELPSNLGTVTYDDLEALWSDLDWDGEGDHRLMIQDMIMNPKVAIEIKKTENDYRWKVIKDDESHDDDESENSEKGPSKTLKYRVKEQLEAAKLIQLARGQKENMEKLLKLKERLKMHFDDEKTIDSNKTLDQLAKRSKKRKFKNKSTKTLRTNKAGSMELENSNQGGFASYQKRKFHNFFQTRRLVKEAEQVGLRLAWEKAYKFVMNNYPYEKMLKNNDNSSDIEEDEDKYLEDTDDFMEDFHGNGGFENHLKMYAV